MMRYYKTDLVLINPGNRAEIYGELSPFAAIAPPLGIGLIASFVRDRGHSVKIIDAEAENISPEATVNRVIELAPLLVGISAYTTKMDATAQILSALKKKAPHIKTIIGGSHPSALPERTLREEDVDFVCKGEGFYPVLQLLEALKASSDDYKIDGLWYVKNGQIVSTPSPPLIKNLDEEIPFVAWDLLPMEKYRAHHWHCFDDIDRRQPYVVVYTGLGCPFRCSFCSVNVVYGRPGIRYRSPENVIEEIDLLVKKYEIRNIQFVDDTFTIKRDRVLHICDLIIERGYDLNIWCYGRTDTVDPHLLRKMKEAGFKWLAYGIEAGNKKIRDGVLKGTDLSIIEEAINMTREAGIYIVGNFIFGLPGDNIQTMQETLDMAIKFDFEYANFYSLMAYPGTKLYEEAIKSGKRLPSKWYGYGQFTDETLPLSTKFLSGADVLKFRDKAFHKYYSYPKYIESIAEKFGPEVVSLNQEILRHKIYRKYA